VVTAPPDSIWAVYGVLRSGEWGWVVAKPQAPALLGLSLTLCLVLGGLIILECSSGGNNGSSPPVASR
jgi:hypothetical protein